MKPKIKKTKKSWISDEEMKRRIAIPASEFCDDQLITFSPWFDAPIIVKLPVKKKKTKRFVLTPRID